MYENLKLKVNSYYDSQIEKFKNDINIVTAGKALDSWYYRDRMTEAAFKAAKATPENQPLPEECKKKMLARFTRENEKYRASALAKLEAAAACEPLESVTFSVEWSNNRTWGKNPTAEVRAYSRAGAKTTSGRASGCGYDKESAAIADACNGNPQFMRLLYDHAEKGGQFSYSIYTDGNGLPWIDGGCGVSCWRSVFKDCGFTFEDVYHGKNSDGYRAFRSEEK